MKKTIIAFAILLAGLSAHAAEKEVPNDTIPIKSEQVTKVVTDETTNAKGKKIVKYYFVLSEQLIPTSKNVVEYYNLSKKHGAKCALAVVVSGKTGRKRIILNQ